MAPAASLAQLREFPPGLQVRHTPGWVSLARRAKVLLSHHIKGATVKDNWASSSKSSSSKLIMLARAT